MSPPPCDQGSDSAGFAISVDGGALFGPVDGIGRYLRSLLPRVIAHAPGDWRWSIFGRGRPDSSLTALRRIEWMSEGFPPFVGRVLSLMSSQPWWLRRTMPDLHWGPAHRLPVGIPFHTASVVTIHDLCWLRAPKTMRKATRVLDAQLMPRALRRADRIIAVSHSTQRDLVEAFPDTEERIVVVHEAAEALPRAETVAALARWNVSSPYVLSVGSIEPRKNLQRLVEAFSALPKSLRSRAQLVIAGGAGWGNVDLVGIAATHGVADRLVLLGAVEDASLSTLYRHARLLAMPSLYEGFGLPVLEALSQGTPVLVSNSSSLPEVVGDAGLCVDPLDVPSIAVGLRRMLEDDALHARLAERARHRSACFSWDRAALETLDVFRAAIRQRAALVAQGNGR